MRNKLKQIKLKADKTIFSVLIIILLITLYTLPLLLNIDKGLNFSQKNCEGIPYLNYNAAHFYQYNMLKNYKPFLWVYFFESGVFAQTVPDDVSLNPFSLLILVFGIVKGINIHYYLMYILGALSMFYLTRSVFRYNLFGAVYSALVFAMCGLFPLLEVRGFISGRETILLPLLVAFFLKAVHSNRYLFPAALVLGFFFMQTGLYFPIIILFLLIFSGLNSFSKQSGRFAFNKRYLVVFFAVLGLGFCLAAFKLFLVLEFMGVENGSSGVSYLQSIQTAYTFSSLLNDLKTSLNSTIYVGYLPLILCFFSGIVLFKRVKEWLIILIIFCILSLGHNSWIDLHYLLWHLPVFNAIDELQKYYSLIIVFCLSLLAGSAFSILEKRFSAKTTAVLSGLLIFFSFLNLAAANYPYFNEYKTDLVFKTRPGNFCQAKVINYQEGDDSGLPALVLSLYLKNIGTINQRYDRQVQKLKNKDIAPKYFIMPEYVFLAPSTKLLILPDPAYKGEAFFRNKTNKAELLSIGPDKIRIKVALNSPDRLLINQNYSKWWQADSGRVENNNGLVSVWLDNPGDYEVSLRFIPLDLYLGIGFSGLTIIVLVFRKKFFKH
jgi:hypothetical protein